MFETNMCDNLAQQSALKAIQGEHTTKWSNPWRKLVSPEYKSFLDGMTTKQEMTEENCDE